MLIQLAVKGILVALMALVIVWGSTDKNKYRKLLWVTLFLTFDLIMFGAFTRLTDSGLGCPDWPGCYGHANPLQAHDSIRAAELALPTGPVTVVKAWIEMIHRYLAMGVGVLIIAIMSISWRGWIKSKRSERKFSPALPTTLFIFVCVQGAFGAWTVTLKLQPIIVTIHLLLGMGLLALLTWTAAWQSEHDPVAQVPSYLRVLSKVALVLLVVQIALGGWVSTNYAALACHDFPLCQRQILPPMDFSNGFTLWRHLGRTSDGEFLPFPALTAIHWVHRNFAVVVFVVAGYLAYKLLKVEGVHKTVRWLLIVLGAQLTTGLLTIYLKWPLALAVLHNGGAAILLLLLVMLNYKINLPMKVGRNINLDAFRPITSSEN